MLIRRVWLFACVITGAAAPHAFGDSPSPASADLVLTVWTGAPDSEVVSSRWTFFHTDDFRAGWYVRLARPRQRSGCGATNLGMGGTQTSVSVQTYSTD